MTRSWKPWLAVLAVLGTCAVLQAANVPANQSLSRDGLASTNKVPNPVTPPPPDPNVIRQGGDTCAAATVISSLPYSDTGTTVGLTDDLQPTTCGYAGGAPDAVYVYTPAADGTITVSLCTATGYDSTVYVLEGTCPGPEVACNDDSCGLQSEIATVPVSAGTPYYIVIDGFSSASGNYSLDVSEYVPPPPPPPPAECVGADLLYYQTVHGGADSWSAATSGQTTSFDYAVADNFDGSGMLSVNTFRFYGLVLLYSGGFLACPDPNVLTFDVRFYDDAGGQPGAETCAYAGVSPTQVATGESYSGYAGYRWELDMSGSPCDPADAAWVSVKSVLNASDCTFLWMSGAGGDGDSLQLNAGVWGSTGYDRGMCINGVAVPVELQSLSVE